MIAKLKPYLSLLKWLAMLAAGVAIGWTANGWRKNAEIAQIKVERASDRATQAEAALSDLTAAAGKINAAALDYAATERALGTKIDSIRKEMKNAPALSLDCKPDDYRVQQLRAAIDAANEATAGR